MMDEAKVPGQDHVEKTRSFGCLQLIGVALAAALVTAAATAWWLKHNVYSSFHTPTELTAPERKALDRKLEQLGRTGTPEGSERAVALPYTEEGAGREISLTEKELNGLIGEDPEMAKKVAVDLADDLVSLNIVTPVEEGVPFFGGKTLRLKAGVTLGYEADRPVVMIRGISLGGLPVPNAWLGNIKNRNLVEEFGSEGGFWQLFADGVEDMKIREGRLLIRLKE